MVDGCALCSNGRGSDLGTGMNLAGGVEMGSVGGEEKGRVPRVILAVGSLR